MSDSTLEPLPAQGDDTQLLTTLERELVAILGQCAELFARHVVARGPNQREDMREAVFYLHALQNMVLAQAASRAYPASYRLLGASLPEHIERRGSAE